MHGYTILNGGDLDENCNYKERKLACMVRTNYVKAILTKMAILERETNHAWLQNFTWGDLNENNNLKGVN